MLTFRESYVWVGVEGPLAERQILYRHMTVEVSTFDQGALFFVSKPLYQPKRQRFPAGLIRHALRLMVKHGIVVQLEDTRTAPSPVRALPSTFPDLHSHQRSGVELLLQHTRGIWEMATGAGKTRAALALAVRMTCPVLFIVNERRLMSQTVEAWKMCTGGSAGVVGGGEFSLAPFTVASIQTLHRRRRDPSVRAYLKTVGCLIVDEVHFAGARSSFDALMRIPAYWRLGMSATPSGRSDSMDILPIAATGPILLKRAPTDLAFTTQESRRLAKPVVVFYRYPKAEHVSGEWHDLYRDGIVQSVSRNVAVLDLCCSAEKPTILFYRNLKHGRLLDRALRQRGLSTFLVSGSDNSDARDEAVKRTRAGSVDVLIASTIFSQGVDIPELRSAVNAVGMKASIATTQRLGRGMRLSDGKEHYVLYDLWDRHSPAFLRHCYERRNTYNDLSAEIVQYATIEEIEAFVGSVRQRRKLGYKGGRCVDS